MENKRCRYDKLWYAKEEVKDLERLLQEARIRLNKEFENSQKHKNYIFFFRTGNIWNSIDGFHTTLAPIKFCKSFLECLESTRKARPIVLPVLGRNRETRQ